MRCWCRRGREKLMRREVVVVTNAVAQQLRQVRLTRKERWLVMCERLSRTKVCQGAQSAMRSRCVESFSGLRNAACPNPTCCSPRGQRRPHSDHVWQLSDCLRGQTQQGDTGRPTLSVLFCSQSGSTDAGSMAVVCRSGFRGWVGVCAVSVCSLE